MPAMLGSPPCSIPYSALGFFINITPVVKVSLGKVFFLVLTIG